MGPANNTLIQRCMTPTCNVCPGRLVAMVLQVNNYCGLPNGTSVTFLEHHELLYNEM